MYSPEELKVIGISHRTSIQYVKDHLLPVDSVVEIGSAYGVNASWILQELNPKVLYLVDPFKYDEFSSSYEKTIPWEPSPEHLRGIFKDELASGRVQFFHMPSAQACYLVPNNLDFVYIDGSHSDYSVTMDIACWYPKLKIGGVLGGHDYGEACAKEQTGLGVGDAVKRIFKDRFTTLPNNTDWWTIRQETF